MAGKADNLEAVLNESVDLAWPEGAAMAIGWGILVLMGSCNASHFFHGRHTDEAVEMPRSMQSAGVRADLEQSGRRRKHATAGYAYAALVHRGGVEWLRSGQRGRQRAQL
uniref:Uncharacterized protein n=1 Tax=Leersia perrieri TaxID=77586 RepID=A0A0D9XHG5_9ORYZ